VIRGARLRFDPAFRLKSGIGPARASQQSLPTSLFPGRTVHFQIHAQTFSKSGSSGLGLVKISFDIDQEPPRAHVLSDAEDNELLSGGLNRLAQGSR